ncbi:ABC transporter ATP-binding protein [Maricaulis parjimensis]|uniref:ABC transporter ATP-binding protein n=1 Tax=Maricaulis parjimensis TaxID=144023 RepID=UPI0019396850|nr:ABC transporter ATP-binding protein [Maricaulis parjimensis]
MRSDPSTTQSDASGQPACFTTRDLTRVFGEGSTEVRALRGVELDIPSGEIVVLLGASGSGKSTLLNILGGLDRASGGEFEFRGRDMTRISDTELTRFRRDHVGFVFQFYNLMPSLTARENVELVTEIAANPMPALDALDLVGLADRADHFPAEMSGGEQQRVAIARAIAKRPEVMLCDEPTGALDSVTGVRVLQALERVNQELGSTILLITHNASVAGMAHRVITLADGQIRETRTNESRVEPEALNW